MKKITFLLNRKKKIQKIKVKTKKGESILDIALKNGIEINHSCQKSCACATCHCIIKKGFQSLNKISESESDMLDKAWGVEIHSRLSCQAIIVHEEDIVVEIPKYTNNYGI